ncbi:MAG: DUF4276 family protein [Planctomycetaceae bacterium]|nr:MAG: DUF4276 family protein [Planctomycetaceae bacterium]
MVKDIAIYFEGGGDTAQTLNMIRRGMSAFLKPVVDEVRSRRIRWRVIPCGSRKQAYYAFVDALDNEPDAFNMLLVDSEEPVAITESPWTHLLNRKADGWKQPAGADDDRCHMMVACMEAWFLADPTGIGRHFGKNFDAAKLPAAALAESRTKKDIEEALKQATRNTSAKEYKKIRDGSKLLEMVESSAVRKNCKWCQRLFKVLGKAIGTEI